MADYYGDQSLASTESTSGSFLGSLSESFLDSYGSSYEGPTIALEGWMYWRRERECWMKVFVVLRNELLWLTRGGRPSRASPCLIQITVAFVKRLETGSFHVQGPSGEAMELYLYDHNQAWAWYDRLLEASRLTERYTESSAPVERASSGRLTSSTYTGTLVAYNKERKKHNPWKRFWSSQGQAWRRRLERVTDKLDKSNK